MEAASDEERSLAFKSPIGAQSQDRLMFKSISISGEASVRVSTRFE
jgi:hypothetical protein